MLGAEGIVPVACVKFRDHHPYSEQDVDRLVDMARASKADGFLTTEKDAVKLSAGMMERLRAVGPVVAPELRVELTDEQTRIEEMLRMLAVKSRKSG